MSVISVTNQNYQNGVLSNQLSDSGREWGRETQSVNMRQGVQRHTLYTPWSKAVSP
jgi:hypothetical protein